MSFAEYLRTKAAASQKIKNTLKPTDASMNTQKKKFMSSHVSPVDGIYGTTRTANDRPDLLNTHPNQKNFKMTGRPQDASSYTAYRGSQGISNDTAFFRGRINNASQCYTIPPPASWKDASTATRDTESCRVIVQGHSAPGQKLGPSMFVDNTISLNGHDKCAPLPVNHNVKAVPSLNVQTTVGFKPFAQILPIGSPIPNPPPKQGAALERAPVNLIGEKHGNPFIGNRHFLPNMPFQPAQRGVRKINEPMLGQIKPY